MSACQVEWIIKNFNCFKGYRRWQQIKKVHFWATGTKIMTLKSHYLRQNKLSYQEVQVQKSTKNLSKIPFNGVLAFYFKLLSAIQKKLERIKNFLIRNLRARWNTCPRKDLTNSIGKKFYLEKREIVLLKTFSLKYCCFVQKLEQQIIWIIVLTFVTKVTEYLSSG